MPVDGGDGQAFGFKHRALLDVDLDEADGTLVGDGILAISGIEAEIRNGLTDRGSFGIFEREHCWIEAAGNRAAADEGDAEAHAFFFRECDDFEGEGQTESFADSTSSRANTTPSTPSKAPASGTVSMCEPRMSRSVDGGSAGFQSPRRLPAASRCTDMPRLSMRARRCCEPREPEG